MRASELFRKGSPSPQEPNLSEWEAEKRQEAFQDWLDSPPGQEFLSWLEGKAQALREGLVGAPPLDPERLYLFLGELRGYQEVLTWCKAWSLSQEKR